jgi:protein PhnA
MCLGLAKQRVSSSAFFERQNRASNPLCGNGLIENHRQFKPYHCFAEPCQGLALILAFDRLCLFSIRFIFGKGSLMSDDDYVYDEETGEWMSASDLVAKKQKDALVEVRDSAGTLLSDGDQVILIKDLEVKGAGQTLRRGTVIKSIRLTGDSQEIDCRYEGIRGLVLRAEFVKKR